MKKLFILLIVFFPINLFALSFNDSLIGTTSTKIRVIYGEPIEKVEYGILNKSSWVYPEHILFFKDNILTKIQSRNEIPQSKIITTTTTVAEKKKLSSETNIINKMFSK